MSGRAEGENALLGAAPFFVTPGATECCVKSVEIEGLLERVSLHHLRVQSRAGINRIDTTRDAFLIDVNDQTNL